MSELARSEGPIGTEHNGDTGRTPLWRRIRKRVGSLFGLPNADSSLRESLTDVLVQHEKMGDTLTAEERLMLMNLLNFGELRVDDVMVPRADIVAVEQQISLEELLDTFHSAAHSRLPVYRDTLDNPVGVIHIKDVMAELAARTRAGNGDQQDTPPFSIMKLRRDYLPVPKSKLAIDLLLQMQSTRNHMALVIDEYGGTDGLVTIEDLVEEIVGEIEDEHDIPEGPLIVARREGVYDAHARATIEELEKILGMNLLPEEREEDIDTLGGLVFSLVGRVPQRGELVSHAGAALEFEVVDADPRRIKRLRIYRRKEPTSLSASDSAS